MQDFLPKARRHRQFCVTLCTEGFTFANGQTDKTCPRRHEHPHREHQSSLGNPKDGREAGTVRRGGSAAGVPLAASLPPDTLGLSCRPECCRRVCVWNWAFGPEGPVARTVGCSPREDKMCESEHFRKRDALFGRAGIKVPGERESIWDPSWQEKSSAVGSGSKESMTDE